MRKQVLFSACCLLSVSLFATQLKIELIPANGAKNINPDTHLVLTFDSEPTLGNRGQIRIYETATNKLIDLLDVSIASGPTKSVNHGNAVPPYTTIPYEYVSSNFTNANTKPGTPSGLAAINADTFQLNIIGRFTDAFHFYPVIIHGNTATIYLHNNILEYNKSYYVQIDSGVFNFKNSNFDGFSDKSWIFSTKKNAALSNSKQFVVDCNGSGDFSTVQGAIDFIPDYKRERTIVYIKNGTYEEIVYFRNKTNVTFVGENRTNTIVCYANNEVFNPHPSNLSTNELPGTFPSRRAAFAADNCSGLQFYNFTIKTTAKGQAEGFLIMGKENILSHMNIIGSGDALQANGSVYFDECKIDGDGDTYLGRGPVFFNHCEFYSKGAFMWIRNTQANHGAILVNCTLKNSAPGETEIARAPENHGKGYPYCEAVLINCKLSGISSMGWGPVGTDISNIHYWEYNSMNLNDGKPIDTSMRSPVSRRLDQAKDAETIKNYCNPEYILGGWTPKIDSVFTIGK
ncbi:MAG: pectinesterase family protein [Paludibacter sp.]|nr:pectinesterase family protein [Paludibacter sp.]